MTKHVFISLPMNGKTRAQIRAEQAELFAKFTRQTHLTDFSLIDSDDMKTPASDRDALKELADALRLMADADAVYFAESWKDARGCRVEAQAAREYGIPVYFEDGANMH